MPPAPAKPQKGKRRGRPRLSESQVQYVIKIEGWDWSFSFGVNRTKSWDDPYWEFRHLIVTGSLRRPAMPKVTAAKLTLMPRIELNEAQRQNHQPEMVGSINSRGAEFEARVSIPADVMTTLVAAFHAGQLRYAVLEGEKLRYGSALVTDLRLDRFVDYGDEP